MKRKSEALEMFKRYKAHAENHTNSTLRKLHVLEFQETAPESEHTLNLKVLRSDNGGEYLSNEFKQFMLVTGIKHELTVTYTPLQNGVAERMNLTLLNLVRSMLHGKGVDKKFWAAALSTAVYIRNRVTSRALPSNITPYHLWYRKTPDLSHIRVFGSKCWYTVPKPKIRKLDPRARSAIMMGYSK